MQPAWSRWYTRTLPDFDGMKLPGYLSDRSLTCPPIAVDSAIWCQEHVAASQVAGDKQLSMYLRYTPIPPRHDEHQRNSPSNGSGLPRARDLLLCCSSPALPICIVVRTREALRSPKTLQGCSADTTNVQLSSGAIKGVVRYQTRSTVDVCFGRTGVSWIH